MRFTLITYAVIFLFAFESKALTCLEFLSINTTSSVVSESNVMSLNSFAAQFSRRTKNFRSDIQNLARKSLSFKTDGVIPVRIGRTNIELLHVVENDLVKVSRAQFIKNLYDLELKLAALSSSDRTHSFVSLLIRRRTDLLEIIRTLDKVTFDRVNAYYANSLNNDKTDTQEMEFDHRIFEAKENLLEEDKILESQIQDIMALILDDYFK